MVIDVYLFYVVACWMVKWLKVKEFFHQLRDVKDQEYLG